MPRSVVGRLLSLSVLIILVLSTAPLRAPEAAASQLAVDTFQIAAYRGTFADGAAKLEAMSAQDPGDVEAVFGAGALQVFAAISRLQQSIRDYSAPVPTGGRGMVFLNMLSAYSRAMSGTMVVPPNPNAKPMTYQILRRLLATFARELVIAEKTLAAVGDRAVKIPVQPFQIAFDLDQDGKISQNERIATAMMGGGGGRRLRDGIVDTTLAFDTADASWLRGYTHVLLAAVNFILAFDFEETYEAGAHNIYGAQATKLGRMLLGQAEPSRPRQELYAELNALTAKMAALGDPRQMWREIRDRQRALRKLKVAPENNEKRLRLSSEIDDLKARQRTVSRERRALSTDQRRLENELYGKQTQYSGVFDLIAFVHSFGWDVVEPERLKAARQHMLQVMEINKTTWRLVRAETDDDREWLPSAAQTPPFGAPKLTDEIIDSWLSTTALTAQVLRGEKLLPHPRFKLGVNLRKIFDNAKRVDLILMISGHDLVPYLEAGEIVDHKAWSAVTNPMGRDFARYAIWFN